jgi:DNA-binding beta-propeller fold protein YncE
MLKHSIYFFLIALIFISCRKDVGEVNFGDYPNDIGKIIVTNCAISGCHNDQSYKAAASLNLSTWEKLFQGSGNGSAIIPYSSKFSFLCSFINTYSDLGPSAEPVMPLNDDPLSYDEVKLVIDWINSGAPDLNGNIKWADDPLRKKLYVVNQGCDVVTVIDAVSQLPMRYIDVGNKPGSDVPHSVRVSPDGQYWYVIFINNNIMQKYRCSDDSYVGDIPLSPKAAGQSATIDGFDWNTMTISKDSKRAYCVSWVQNGRVAAVDLVNRKLLHFLPNFTYPHGIVLNDAEDSIYVGAQTGNYLSVIDTGFTTKYECALEAAPVSYTTSLDIHDVILSHDKQEIIVTCQNSNEVRKLNLSTRQITAINTGIQPQEIVYSPSTHQYFVSCPYDATTFPNSLGMVMKFNEQFTASTNIQVGYQPHGIGVDESKKVLYVLSRNLSTTGPAPHHTNACGGRNGFLNIIDMNTLKVLPKKYELSSDPYFVFARP